MTYRVLVTGWRDWPESHRGLIWAELDFVAALTTGPIVVIHGRCPHGGVDLYADQWASLTPDGRVERHPAENFGPWPACGPKRNSHMVGLGADICLVFPGPGSRGTWDCVRKAVDADIPTIVKPWTSRRRS